MANLDAQWRRNQGGAAAMTCPKCDRDYTDQCECGYRPKAHALAVQEKKPLWLVQYCSVNGCESRIRVPADAPLVTPICKWCDAGTSHAMNPMKWPAGMPDPELPWPWMTDKDRETKLRLPFWKERLRSHGELYKHWFKT